MEKFTATHHALLFAWISRAVINTVGEERGEQVVRQAVIQYALQRGRRMAIRAERNGHELSMANYLAYGEWAAQKGEMKQKIQEKVPDTRVHILKCPWHCAWKENDLIPYGRYFCLEVDEALVKGFNKDLVIEINGTQSNGADFCEFNFKKANLTPINLAGLIVKKKVRPGKKAIMPWEYHVGHLFKTMGEAINAQLGDQAAEIMAVSLKDFTDRYGEAAGKVVTSYDSVDFNKLP